MKTINSSMIATTCIAAVAAAPVTFAVDEYMAESGNRLPANVNSVTGAIEVPFDYTSWPTLGVWSHANTEGLPGAKELHLVYTQRETIEFYKKRGRFPDAAVLVKELVSTKTKGMSTGPSVSHANSVKGWFVMVRDTEGRFKDSALWGDGWGWSYFRADDPFKTTTSDYRSDCLSCHLPARDSAPADAADADKWIYTFGYPALKDSVTRQQ